MTTDDPELPELTRRQEELLSLIIHTYTHNPEPVSSKYLVEAFKLGFSSATIRNEMAVLEEKGYITAPHTSAGRVPTESGYRYFVKRLMHSNDLSQSEQDHIVEKFQSSPLATEEWMRLAARVLARTSQTASLVTAPIAELSRFKHLELIAIHGRLVLMVLVLHGGTLQQQMLNLAEPVAQETLSEVAARINLLCLDLSANEVRMKGIPMQLLEREVAELVADLMENTDSSQMRMVYRDGLSEVIGSFHDSEGAQQAIRVFEERAFLDMILSELVPPLGNNVQVIIAGERRWEELRHLTMVLSRYGIPGQVSGALGVLGPTHINYGRAIGSVRLVSSVLTKMLASLYEETKPDSLAETPDETEY